MACSIGLVGAGKLGLPVAVALSWQLGQKVSVYDADPDKMKKRRYEHIEGAPGDRTFQELFDGSGIDFLPLREVVTNSDIIFVAVQTPHDPAYDGSTPSPLEPKDFNYIYLKIAIEEIVRHVRKDQIISVISTVLPGTIRRDIMPIVGTRCGLVYNPFFAAMGTCVKDFLNPEFVLLGGEDSVVLQRMFDFYASFISYIHSPILRMSTESAELVKVGYNLFITMKIAYINTLMEIAHKTPGCNIDAVTDAMKIANKRLTSPAYMTGGMVDAGSCHPRDLIAMKWLTNQLGLSYDLFTDLARSREQQTFWLASRVWSEAKERNLPVYILGKAFKPGTNITAGSASLLLRYYLEKTFGLKIGAYDPYIDNVDSLPTDIRTIPRCFVVATKHPEFVKWHFPPGSVVIDPFRYMLPQKGVEIVRIGEGPAV